MAKDTQANDTGGSGASTAAPGDTGCVALHGGGLGAGDFGATGCGETAAPGGGDPPIPGDGVLVGGGCSCDAASAPHPLAAWILILLFVRRLSFLGALLVPALARAVDVDTLDPDGGTWTALREGDLGEPGEAQVSLVGDVMRSPAVVSDGETSADVLSLVAMAGLAGSVNLGRIQISGFVPRYPLVVEDATVFPLADQDPRILSLPGDVGFGVGVAIAPDHPSQWSVSARTNLATGAADHLLGDPASRLTLANDTAVGRHFHLGGQLGLALREKIALPGSVWGRSAEYGAGVAWRPAGWEQLAVEGFGAIGLVGATKASLPLEVLATSRSALDPLLDVRFAGGTGLGAGLGNPTWRFLLEIDAHGRIDRDRDGDGRPDIVDLCPRRPEDHDQFHSFDACPDPDDDRDGLLDAVDHCPRDAEVWNGWSDEDGCPDDLAHVVVSLEPGVESAEVSVEGSPPSKLIAGDTLAVDRPPGDVLVAATSDGFEPLYVVYQAEEGRSELELRLVPVPPGGVAVSVVDADGAAVHARILAGTTEVDAPEGRARIPHAPGPVEVEVSAEGFEPATSAAVVPEEGDAEVVVRVARPAVREQDHALLGDQIRFALDESRIVDSSGALDAYAAWLAAHPEVTLLRIEGHADAVGTSAYNLELSIRRAQAVRDALLARGVEPARLQTVGSGEAFRAGDPASQRLVDFLVLVWDERDVAEMPVAPGIP